jgi:hypothetical protein
MEIETEIERRSQGINFLPEDHQKIAEPWLQAHRKSYLELRDMRASAKAELEGVGVRFWLKTGLQARFEELDRRFQEMRDGLEKREISFIREAKIIAERNRAINEEKRRKVFGNLHLRLRDAQRTLEFSRAGEEGVCIALIRGDVKMAIRMAEIHCLIKNGHASGWDIHEQATYIASYHNPEPAPQQSSPGPDLYGFYMDNMERRIKVVDGVWEEVMPANPDSAGHKREKTIQLIEGVVEKENLAK